MIDEILLLSNLLISFRMTLAEEKLKSAKKDHGERHEQKPSHQCDICSKVLKTKCSLQLHVKVVHEKERPHKCDVCEKCFGAKSTLNSHFMREM